MQQTARLLTQHPAYGTYVSPVHAVERVRVRIRRARVRRPDFVSLYIGAGIAGIACGFLLSVL